MTVRAMPGIAAPRFVKNIGGFFSDYFLGELLERKYKGRLGERERYAAWMRLRSRWERAALSLGSGASLTETRRRWLDYLLESLGFVPGSNLREGGTIEAEKELLREPYVFYPNGSGEPCAYIALYAWGEDLDAPIPGAGRRTTPHKHMERLLNFGRARWGILTNGRIVRLLRRREVSAGRAFLEVDLESTFEEGDEATFRVFWSLFRA